MNRSRAAAFPRLAPAYLDAGAGGEGPRRGPVEILEVRSLFGDAENEPVRDAEPWDDGAERPETESQAVYRGMGGRE